MLLARSRAGSGHLWPEVGQNQGVSGLLLRGNIMYALRYEKKQASRGKDLHVSQKHEPKPPPVRYRLSVPAADTTVNDWLAEQDNQSASIRAVIREFIERNGFIDPTCRPVSQLPRRGRPPGQTGYDAEGEDRQGEPDGEVDLSAYEGSGGHEETSLGLALAHASGRAAEGQQQVAQAERDKVADQPVDGAPGDEPASMDDIFSTGRNR